MKEFVLKGIPAAPGIAMGQAFILDKQDFLVLSRAIMVQEIPIEVARFEEALIKTREEILDIQKKINAELMVNHAQIFDSHLLVLEDRTLIEEVVKRIKAEKLCAEYVFSEVIRKYIKIISNIEDEYLRERISDVTDVTRRVLKNLMEEINVHEFDHLTGEIIIVSHDLSPSDTASMINKSILAFITDIGGRTSHTAIMAKSLGIPAVVALKDVTLRIHNQNFMIVDGRKGLVIVHPTDETKELYRNEKSRILEFRGRYEHLKDLPAETLDGKNIHLLANLELPAEIPAIKSQGAMGVGLYRTEYFYMNRVDLPTEEEQFEAYKYVVEAMKPHQVTIRSLDIGGDKFVSSLQIPHDMYPFLGWRAIRFCLARPDIFKTQLRAILKASVFGNIRLMYPMISGPGDFRQANVILNETKENLRQEKIPFNEEMPVGAMIEVPSAALTADLLAQEADFFSIGTNDLIQYCLAVDRVNEKTADFYEPGHLAILRLIQNTILAGHKEGIKVGLCGEMAGEPTLALVLLGLHIDELSMTPLSIPQIKKLIRTVNLKDAQELAENVLKLSTGPEVEEMCKAALKRLTPDFAYDLEGNSKKSG